jgi:hypothetical protein
MENMRLDLSQKANKGHCKTQREFSFHYVYPLIMHADSIAPADCFLLRGNILTEKGLISYNTLQYNMRLCDVLINGV